MKKRKTTLVALSLIICLLTAFGMFWFKNKEIESNPEKVILKIEEALGDEYEKQSVTELAATLVYGDPANSENKVYCRILKTTFYECDPAEITGLHTEAFEVLFPVERMESCEKMKIQGWDAALYKMDDMAYLCWTYTPEISYALEYNPGLVEDEEIIKMAESAKFTE